MSHARYTILRKITDGGTAEIFLAKQHGAQGFEKTVVLKRIFTTLYADPQFRHMLVDEAHVAMSLNHSNIVQVLDLGESEGRYFLALELVDGWTLDRILKRSKAAGVPIPPALALYVTAEICRALRLPESAIVETTWIDNGPGWVGVLLEDAAAVLALEPDWAAFGDLKIGAVGPYAEGPLAVEVRAFCPGYGMPEDPVTGSLNAGIGQWLSGGVLPTSYVASQGTSLQRAGRVHVVLEGQTVWVGGDTRTTVAGTVDL